MSIYQDRANGVLTEEMFNWGKEAPRWSSVASVAMSLGSGFEQIGDWISGDSNNSLARATSAVRSGVSENTDWMIGNWDAFDFVYNTTMSGVDSLAVSWLPGGTGGVLLGLSAAAQATNDALDRGMSQKQAFWNGLAAGIFEGIFEKWSIGNFKGLKEVASTHAKEIAKNIAKSMLVNASEETLTEIANIAYDSIVNGDFSQYETKVRQYVLNGMTEAEAKKKAALDLGGQVVESGASGALMGFGFGTIGSAPAVVQNVSNKVKSNQALKGQEYAQLKNAAPQIIAQALSLNPDNLQAKKLMAQLNSGKGFSVGDLQTLQTLAEESAAVTSKTQKNTAEVGVKYSLRESADNQAFANGNAANEHVSVTPEDVTNMLRSKRVDTKTATGITDAIVASLNGRELTKTQSERLSSALDSPTVLSVISELMKKKADGIDSTLKNAYDEINTIGGNKNGQEATLWHLSNQRADGSLQSHQTQTRAEDGNGSGVPETLRENKGLPHATLPTEQRRGLISDLDAFSNDDYATVTEGSALHQVQKAVPEENYAGGSKTRTFREATQQDADLIIGIKTRYNAGKTRNAASAKGTINGKSIALECISGKFSHDNYYNKGNFEPPQPENYHYQGPIPEYTNHTEQKIVEYLREQFKDNPNVSGEIEIISERIYCDNCKALVDMFEAEFPNIKVTRVEVLK